MGEGLQVVNDCCGWLAALVLFFCFFMFGLCNLMAQIQAHKRPCFYQHSNQQLTLASAILFHIVWEKDDKWSMTAVAGLSSGIHF
jgi:hypothetical protein